MILAVAWRLPPIVALFSLFIFSDSINWLLAYAMFVIGSFWVDMSTHRYASHNEIKPSKIMHHFIWFVASCWRVGCPITFRGVHLRHHQHSGADKDPHCAELIGLRLIFHNPSVLVLREDSARIKSMVRDSNWLFWSKHNTKFCVGSGLVLWSLGEFYLLHLWAVPVLAIHVYLSISSPYLAHKLGYTNHTCGGKNTWQLWPLYFGSVYHNNHHKKCTGSTAHKKYEFDPNHYITKFIGRF